MNRSQQKIQRRVRRHTRVRSVVSGSDKRPRLSIYRANQHIYAQLIDDTNNTTIASASSLEIKDKATKTDIATKVGSLIAEKAAKANVTEVVFDRGGFRYHGRIKALADAARAAGLKF